MSARISSRLRSSGCAMNVTTAIGCHEVEDLPAVLVDVVLVFCEPATVLAEPPTSVRLIDEDAERTRELLRAPGAARASRSRRGGPARACRRPGVVTTGSPHASASATASGVQSPREGNTKTSARRNRSVISGEFAATPACTRTGSPDGTTAEELTMSNSTGRSSDLHRLDEIDATLALEVAADEQKPQRSWLALALRSVRADARRHRAVSRGHGRHRRRSRFDRGGRRPVRPRDDRLRSLQRPPSDGPLACFDEVDLTAVPVRLADRVEVHRRRVHRHDRRELAHDVADQKRCDLCVNEHGIGPAGGDVTAERLPRGEAALERPVAQHAAALVAPFRYPV